MQIPKSISEAKKMFTDKTLKPSELVEYYLKIISEQNPALNAVLNVFKNVSELAKIADENYAKNSARSLEGIPFLVKDCILVKGEITSAGSQMLKNFVAPYDATCIRLLKEAGAIILGHTNMDEFALGGSGENSSFGKTLNPLDIEKVPGGSSSGSASALAASMCLAALGSDTGGSVRQPASFCGLYGFKPSYGGISRNGLIAAASSLDTIGIFTNSAEDTQLIFEIISQEDRLDNTSIPENLRREISTQNKFTKIVAYPTEYLENAGLDKQVKADFFQSLEILKNKGYEILPVDIASLKYALSVYYILNTAEVSTNLSRMDGLRFGGGAVGEVKNYQDLFSQNRGKYLGPEVKRRIILGTYVLSHGYYEAFYGKANILRQLIKDEFQKVFQTASIVLMPTAPTTAFKSGEIKDPLTLYLEDIYTVPANLAGLPAISIPTNLNTDKLPMSLQAIAPFGLDKFLFQFAKDFKGL